MSETKTIKLVGGPFDGREVEVPSHHLSINMMRSIGHARYEAKGSRHQEHHEPVFYYRDIAGL